MPTTNAPPRLSINVGTSDVELSSFKDIEVGQESVIDNVGKYECLSVSPTRVANKFLVYTGRFVHPSFSRYMMWFGLSLFLSLLSPLPIFVSVTLPYKEMQKYQTSQCTTIAYVSRKHVGYISIEETFVATLRYTDANGVSQTGRFVHDIGFLSDVDINSHLSDFYRSTYYSEVPYLCYYSGDKVIAADSTEYIIDYATEQGWVLMVGLLVAWAILILVTVFGFHFRSVLFINNRRVVNKQIFEGPFHTQMEVMDWGDVPLQMRQSLHAILYTFLIPQESVVLDTKKVVRFTRIEINRSARPAIYVGTISTMLALAGVITTAALAFTQERVAYAQLMWVVTAICAVLPCVLACATIRCVAQFSFSATAEVTCKTSPTEDIRIASAYYSPLRLSGVLLIASLFRTVI